MNLRSVVILTILFILALVGISFYGGPVTYIFLFLVVATPLVCFVYIRLTISSIKIYQKSDGRGMTASVPGDFYITLNNEGLFSFSSVRLKFFSSFSSITGFDDKTVYELPPHSSVTKKTGLVCRYRGEYLVGIKELEVKDFLGLFTVNYRIKEPLSVIVAPAMKQLDTLRAGDVNADAYRDSLTNKNEPDIIVREYVPGDSVRLMHYNATAVMQKPMIRELKGGEKEGVTIIMEAGRWGETTEEYLPIENRIIESTLALSLYYIKNNIPVNVYYRELEMKKLAAGSYREYENLYEVMRRYSFREKDNTLRLINEIAAAEKAFSGTMIIFVLYKLTGELLDVIERMNYSRIPVRIYLAGENPGDDTSAFESDCIEIFPLGTTAPTEDVL